jgi:hypothetical protein
MNAFCRQDSPLLAGAGALEVGEDKGASAIVGAGVAAGALV